jgi:hypothetical protein
MGGICGGARERSVTEAAKLQERNFSILIQTVPSLV